MPRAHKHLANTPNYSLQKAHCEATKPIYDPFGITILYNDIISKLPTPLDGIIMSAIYFIAISFIYLYFICYGIFRVHYYKFRMLYSKPTHTAAKKRRRKKKATWQAYQNTSSQGSCYCLSFTLKCLL